MQKLVIPRTLQIGTLGTSLEKFVTHPSTWCRPQTLQRHFLSVEKSAQDLRATLQTVQTHTELKNNVQSLEKELKSLTQANIEKKVNLQNVLKEKRKSLSIVDAKWTVLRDVFYDPQYPWDKSVLESFNADTTNLSISSLVVGTAHFPETAGITRNCSKHPANVPFDANTSTCTSCARYAIHQLASDILNHEIMFTSINVAQNTQAKLDELIEHTKYKSLLQFQEDFVLYSTNHLASGWTWLAYNPKTQKIEILNTPGNMNVLTLGLYPLACIDMWEHAWLNIDPIDPSELVTSTSKHPLWSRNARRVAKGLRVQDLVPKHSFSDVSPEDEKVRYVTGFWNIIDWNVVGERLVQAKKQQESEAVALISWDAELRNVEKQARVRVTKKVRVTDEAMDNELESETPAPVMEATGDESRSQADGSYSISESEIAIPVAAAVEAVVPPSDFISPQDTLTDDLGNFNANTVRDRVQRTDLPPLGDSYAADPDPINLVNSSDSTAATQGSTTAAPAQGGAEEEDVWFKGMARNLEDSKIPIEERRISIEDELILDLETRTNPMTTPPAPAGSTSSEKSNLAEKSKKLDSLFDEPVSQEEGKK